MISKDATKIIIAIWALRKDEDRTLEALDEMLNGLTEYSLPQKGKWEPVGDISLAPENSVFGCSECGYIAIGEAEISNFCPACGADMREE